MSICYIVGAGDFPYGFSPNDDDLVIAADGGYDHLVKNGIRCDLLLGDLDSVKSVPSDVEILRFPVRKDETDMHLAFLEGKARGYGEFHIYGGSGGRDDHTFANYCLLMYIREHGGRATLFSKSSYVTLIKGESITIRGKRGNHLSLFPFGSPCTGVTVKGAEYECENIGLFPDFPITASNRFLDRAVFISVRQGALLIIGEI